MVSESSKDPRRVAAGKAGMRARWGEQPRIVRLDDLTMEQRRLVVALVEAAKSPAAAAHETPAAADAHGAGRERSQE